MHMSLNVEAVSSAHVMHRLCTFLAEFCTCYALRMVRTMLSFLKTTIEVYILLFSSPIIKQPFSKLRKVLT